MSEIGQLVNLESIIELVEKNRALVETTRENDVTEPTDRWYDGSDAFSKALLDNLKAMRTCSCLSELDSDAYGSGGPMSGKPHPAPCVIHPNQDGKRQTILPTYPRGPIKD